MISSVIAIPGSNIWVAPNIFNESMPVVAAAALLSGLKFDKRGEKIS